MAEITLVKDLNGSLTEQAHREGCAHLNRYPAHMVVGTYTAGDRHELAVVIFGDVAREEIGQEHTPDWHATCDQMLSQEIKIVGCTKL